MLKRLFDVCSAIFGLIVSAPLFLVIAILIKTTSRGPVIYKQRRVGLHGKEFLIFKFRTMVQQIGIDLPVTKKSDPRITPIGRLLRISKLDEIPQLFNVLLGQMSIVGPRPEIPELVAHYTEQQRRLLLVKPGLTSPASIYHRDEEVIGTDEEVLEYHRKILIPKKASFDLAYIEKQSFWYDLKLIALTLIAVSTNQSGYMRDTALKQRKIVIFFAHIFVACIAFYLAFLIRFDGYIPHGDFIRFQKTIAVAVLLKVIFLYLFGLSHGYWRYVGIRDAMLLAQAIIIATLTFLVVEFLFLDHAFPTGVIFLDCILSFLLLVGVRFSTRFLREAYYPLAPKDKEKVLILGAGDRTDVILREMVRNPDIGYEVAGLIDIDAHKVGLTIQGIKVLGTPETLEGLLRGSDITSIINTYSSLDRHTTQHLSKCAARFGIKIKTLPSLSDVLLGKNALNKLQDLKYEELLGRDEVHLDTTLLTQIYTQKRVLVTGAGGSIGSELVRQLTNFNPACILLLDKDETLLYDIQTEIRELNPDTCLKALIGDIRDTEKIRQYFVKYNPEVVLHAAAYKHVPLLEEHPQEAYINNVFGTRNILSLSEEYGVERFVMISTDKAVRPTNVMGATKALAERILLEVFEKRSKMKCMAVRFGNVLGSRGSVIPLFRRQIERGGPLRLTHAEVTRFFMSIPEAAQLVLQAGAMGQGGEIFILKMGDPVKIKDLAYQMIEYSGLIPEIDIQIEYIGMRPGEKMYEELLTSIENAQASSHQKIYIVPNTHTSNPNLLVDINQFGQDILQKSNTDVRNFLCSQVIDYHPQNTVD